MKQELSFRRSTFNLWAIKKMEKDLSDANFDRLVFFKQNGKSSRN